MTKKNVGTMIIKMNSDLTHHFEAEILNNFKMKMKYLFFSISKVTKDKSTLNGIILLYSAGRNNHFNFS